MTANEFRKLALAMPGAVESSHMNHPDFRANGKIFASLAYPDESWAMVKLTPDQQASFMKQAPDMFRPCKGVWGERGATNVNLELATMKLVSEAMRFAHQNLAAQPKPKAKRAPAKRKFS